MSEELYTHIDTNGIIVSLALVTAEMQTALHKSHERLAFQLLMEKPILCVFTTSDKYPVLYPDTTIIPETTWGHFEADDDIIFMNVTFVSRCLEKSIADVTFMDLLSVFEMLTDAEKLIKFGDTYGLIVVGTCRVL